jgi:hypothetical protein
MSDTKKIEADKLARRERYERAQAMRAVEVALWKLEDGYASFTALAPLRRLVVNVNGHTYEVRHALAA